jgi:hypothetical protein
MFHPEFIISHKVSWYYYLSRNPNAIHLLEKNVDKVRWDCLSGNPNAIHILEKNLDKVNWDWLSKNPNAIHILEKNVDKVCWECLSLNPNAIHLLAKLNIKKMREKCKPFAKELVEYVFHPLRQENMAQKFNMDLDEYMEQI